MKNDIHEVIPTKAENAIAFAIFLITLAIVVSGKIVKKVFDGFLVLFTAIVGGLISNLWFFPLVRPDTAGWVSFLTGFLAVVLLAKLVKAMRS